MKRTAAFLVAICLLGLFLDDPSIPSSSPVPNVVALQTMPARAVVDHLSSTRTSDGTTTVYCVVKNTGEVPITSLHAKVFALDSNETVLQAETTLLFQGDTLRPQGRAIFTTTFVECWDCASVRVSLF